MKLVETGVIATIKETALPNQLESDPEASLDIVSTKQANSQGLGQYGDHETGASVSTQMAQLKPNHNRKIAEFVELNKNIIYRFEDELRDGQHRLAELERKFDDQKNFIQEILGPRIGRDS